MNRLGDRTLLPGLKPMGLSNRIFVVRQTPADPPTIPLLLSASSQLKAFCLVLHLCPHFVTQTSKANPRGAVPVSSKNEPAARVHISKHPKTQKYPHELRVLGLDIFGHAMNQSDVTATATT